MCGRRWVAALLFTIALTMTVPASPGLGQTTDLAASTIIEGCVDATSARLWITTPNAPCTAGEVIL